MAVKQYGYYIKGNKISIVEKDTAFDNDINSKDYGPGSQHAHWKSPITSVTNGIEFEYVYSPVYSISETYKLTTLTGYYRSIGNESDDAQPGMLKLIDATSTYTNYDSSFNVGDKIVLKNAGRWNGIHEVVAFASATGTNNIIVTNTPVDDPDIKTTVITNFEDTPDLYHQIELLEDENDRIPGLPSYLQKALVYYVKAKIAEDTMNLEAKEYFMKEFRKMVEKYNNTRVAGLRIQAAGPFSIR